MLWRNKRLVIIYANFGINIQRNIQLLWSIKRNVVLKSWLELVYAVIIWSMAYTDFKFKNFFADFPSPDIHENCTDKIAKGDCNGENFTFMCVLIDLFSAIIVVVNLVILVMGIIVIRRKQLQVIRVCEFYLILNLAFSDMVTGILSLTIDGWDFIAEVNPSISFKWY